jgi:hypothetical protein
MRNERPIFKMMAGPHRDTRAYRGVFEGPAAFQGARHRSQRGSVDSMVDLQFL